MYDEEITIECEKCGMKTHWELEENSNPQTGEDWSEYRCTENNCGATMPASEAWQEVESDREFERQKREREEDSQTRKENLIKILDEQEDWAPGESALLRAEIANTDVKTQEISPYFALFRIEGPDGRTVIDGYGRGSEQSMAESIKDGVPKDLYMNGQEGWRVYPREKVKVLRGFGTFDLDTGKKLPGTGDQ